VVFFRNVRLRFKLAIDHSQIALGFHCDFSRVTPCQCVQKLDRRLVPKRARAVPPALLRLVVAPELAEQFRGPPLDQCAQRQQFLRQPHPGPSVEEHVLCGVVRQLGAATGFVEISGIVEGRFGVVHHALLPVRPAGQCRACPKTAAARNPVNRFVCAPRPPPAPSPAAPRQPASSRSRASGSVYLGRPSIWS